MPCRDIGLAERGRPTAIRVMRASPLAIAALRHAVVGLIVVWGGPLAAAGELENLIRNVRDNERIYENIQFNVKESYTDSYPDVSVPFPVVKASETNERYIYQGMNVLTKYDSSTTDAGAKDSHAQNRMNVFDGRTTRSLNYNVMHIADEPMTTATMPHAHNLILPSYARIPFSAVCQGTAVVKKIKAWGDRNVDPVVVGREQLDGNDCVKLKVVMYRDGQDQARVGFVRIIWVDTGRNYLPIRLLGYAADSSPEHAEELSAVDSMIQLEPGVWFPSQVTHKTYAPERGFQDNKVKLLTVAKYSEVELDPKNDPAIFQGFAVAPDVVKYIMKDGKIIQKIPAPQPAGTIYRTGMSAGTKAGIVVSIGLCIASAIFCYHKFKNR